MPVRGNQRYLVWCACAALGLWIAACGGVGPDGAIDRPARANSSGSAPNAPTSPAGLTDALIAPPEQPVSVIDLRGPAALPDAEISGMAWHGDTLVLLPQYPGWLESKGASGRLFAVTRAALEDALDGVGPGSITPREVPFDAGDIADRVPGFEGFEAVAFSGDRAYLAIEGTEPSGRMAAYLAMADVQGDLAAVKLRDRRLIFVELPANLDNMSVESLVVAQDRVIALFEANGANVNPRPQAYTFDLDLQDAALVPFPTIEYRVTDATEAGPDGRFWVVNFYWRGEADLLRPAADRLAARYGEGSSHEVNETVERLLPMQVRPDGIVAVDAPPVQLELIGDAIPRNWEGVVQLGDRGFVLVTDQFPVTVLAFVPLPQSRGAPGAPPE